MNEILKILIRRKWAFAFFFVLGFGSILLVRRVQGRTYEGIAVVKLYRSEEARGNSALASPKGIINPLVMEKAVQGLGWARAGDPAEKIQKKILELQKKITVKPEGQSGVIEIRVRDTSGEAAVKAVNIIAAAFEETNREAAGAEAHRFQEYLLRQIEASEKKISELEVEIAVFEKNTPMKEMAARLERDIAHAYEARAKLLKVFTTKHPEIIKLDEEIAHMESDLAALPQPEVNIEELKTALAEERASSQSFSDQRQNAIFKEVEEAENVSILRRAIHPVPVKAPISFFGCLRGIFAGLFSGAAIVFYLERIRSKPLN